MIGVPLRAGTRERAPRTPISYGHTSMIGVPLRAATLERAPGTPISYGHSS